ncbi:MAG: gamma-glutamyl-gamma-aminobutyrate hydrolase family protein [Pseudomonadota bacterium]
MTKLLIIEGNTPARVAAGQAAATAFLRSFDALGAKVVCDVLNPFDAPVTATDFASVDGVIFSGSGEAWSVDAPEVAVQRQAMEHALAADLPIWGSCNGMQLAMVVFGGACGKAPAGKEVGVARDLVLTAAGESHAMMDGRCSGFGAPSMHRDHITRLPDRACLLAGNHHSSVQAVVYETENVQVWATQYHPELSPADVAGYIRSQGIYEDETAILPDLDQAEDDANAARRLGANPGDLLVQGRATELGNWLRFVKERAGRQSVS